MGSSENDVPVPALPVNEPVFSIRDYVLAARAKNISRNWPFPEKYLQTCMIHGVSKVLPPFDTHKSVKNILYRKEKKSDIGSVLKKCTGLNRGKEIIEVNCNISTLNTYSNQEMDEQCITAEASCSKWLNSNGHEENFICVKDVKCDIAPVQNICEGHDREEEILEANDNVISTSNSNPTSNIEENSSGVNMKSDNGSIRKHCVGLNCREELVQVNGDVSATSNSNLKSNEEENSDCVKGDKPDTGAVTCVGVDIGVNGNESTSNSNSRSNIEENSSCAKDMESNIGSIQKTRVGLDRREDILEVNGVVSATSNSNLKPNRDENSDCIKDDKLDTGAITCVGHDCKEISEVNGNGNGNVSPSDSDPRSNIEENSSCVKDMKFDMVSVQKNCVSLDRREDTFEANGVVCATSNSNLKSSREENSDCIKDDKSDTGTITCIAHDCKEINAANGNVSSSDSNPRSNEEGNSNGVKDVECDTGAINLVGVNCEEEIIGVNGNATTSISNPRSNEEENSDIGSLQNNCVGFNHEEETIEVNSNVNTTSNLNLEFSEELDEQCLEAAASCSKRLNSKQKKRKRKTKMRLVADVVADAKPFTLEERDKINGSTWAIDHRVIYRRMSTRIKAEDEDEVNYGTKETTAINNILETRSAERLQKIRQHRKGTNTDEDDIDVVEKKPALVSKLKLRKPPSSTVEVNTPIKNDSKGKSVVTRTQVKRSLPSVNGISTTRRLRKRGRS